MKRLFFLLFTITWVCGTATSCKKDNTSPPPGNPLLSGVSRNGVTQLELAYDTDKRLIRANYYSNGALSTYTLYEYDEKGIRETRRYDADDHALEYRRVFTLDNFGRIIRSENYASPNLETIAVVIEYAYDASDQPINKEFRVSGSPVYYREDYAYDGQGNLTMLEKTFYPGQPGEYLGHRYTYTPGDKPVPIAWKDYLFLLAQSGIDDRMREVFNAGSSFTSWDDEGELSVEYEYSHSDQQYDDQGRLVRQAVVRKTLHDEAPDQSTDKSYAYSE